MATAIRALLTSNDQAILSPDLAPLRPLYAERNFQPIWSGNAETRERANVARMALAHADDQGLSPADYAIQTAPAANPAQQAAEEDVALTQAVLRYARDVRTGRLPPNAIYRDSGLPDVKFDSVSALAGAVRNGGITNFLADLPPTHAEYRRLVSALAQYRAMEAQGGWPAIPAAGEIKIDTGDSREDLLRRRLAVEDPDTALTTGGDLLAALKRYQMRNGLTPDGRVGKLTLEMLNVSASERVAQIEANMERWRWLPRTFERRYIAVNAPDESLQFVEDGIVTLTSRVIIGRPQSPTPIFRANAVAVTANPPWNVPHAIAVKEILPKLKRDPNYLASQDMILVNGPPGDPAGVHINWRAMTAREFPYRIQQVPGAKNALGALKLELPNKFNVYLHDTPGKVAFERDQRALSHGCIRVQQILPLAALALGGDRQMTLDDLNAAIGSGVTQQIKLNDPLPIYVLYWTAIAQEDGTVAFRRDLYGRDRRLTETVDNRLPLSRLAMYTGGCQILPG
jgi:murein L,D-transpeptidase YcbB/YkuD